MDEHEDKPAVSFLSTYRWPLVFGGVSLFCIIASLVLLLKTTQVSEPIQFTSTTASGSGQLGSVTVDIEGSVRMPGIYELPMGSRIEDALEKAGGITNQADSEWVAKMLNRASLVSDGAKLFIPQKGAVSNSLPADTLKSAENGSTRGALISINTGTEKELDSLSGVGPVTVEKIISNRPYQRLEELLEKKIIGVAVWEKIKENIAL